MHREREPGATPGLSRSGMQERQLPSALARTGWEAAAIRYIRPGCGPASPKTCQPCRVRRTRRRIASWNGRATGGLSAGGLRVSGDAHRFLRREITVHIEPGIVEGSKIVLSYATAAGVGLYGLRATWQTVRERGFLSLLFRSLATTALVFTFFQVFPHVPVGVSEVHLILGSTLFLLFGVAPAAIGLAAGLLLQGVLFAPFDLPQYGMNVTTLLVPLFGLQYVAHRVIAPNTPYVDLRYPQVLKLSATYQAGIVSWVGFWALYGQGITAHTLGSIVTFGAAYLVVILIEPLADLSVLAAAKTLKRFKSSSLVEPRLFNPA